MTDTATETATETAAEAATDPPQPKPSAHDPIDPQRRLFRFLSKSARKGEPADPQAAADRAETELDQLPDLARQMQTRIAAAYPDAPRLTDLLDAPDPDTLAAIGRYDWVQVGIYTFGLPPTKARAGTPESAAHRWLKEWAAAHPERVGADRGSVPITERWFPSGDECDVAFLNRREATIVEVRPDGAEEHELRRAIFTLVKLRALLRVEDELAPCRRYIRPVLLVGGPIPLNLRPLASRLRVLIISQSRPSPLIERRERLLAEREAQQPAEQAEQAEPAQPAAEQEDQEQTNDQPGG